MWHKTPAVHVCRHDVHDMCYQWLKYLRFTTQHSTYFRTWAIVFGPNHSPMALPSDIPMLAAEKCVQDCGRIYQDTPVLLPLKYSLSRKVSCLWQRSKLRSSHPEYVADR